MHDQEVNSLLTTVLLLEYRRRCRRQTVGIFGINMAVYIVRHTTQLKLNESMAKKLHMPNVEYPTQELTLQLNTCNE